MMRYAEIHQLLPLKRFFRLVVARARHVGLRIIGVALIAVFPLLSTAANYDYSNASISPDSERKSAPPIDDLIGRLEQRLAADSNDFSGWLLLMQSYLHLDAPEQAKLAFQRALALAGDSADELVRLATAIEQSVALLGVTSDELIRKALALNPDHLQASRLAADRVVRGTGPSISYISALLGEPVRAPDQGHPAAALQMQVHVSLSEPLQTEVLPTDVVFVFVRSASKPMPLAVVRKQVKDLPFHVVFDESTAMIKGHTFTREQTDLEVVARVSRSGDTMGQKGDLQGTYSGVSATHSDTIEVVVDTLVN